MSAEQVEERIKAKVFPRRVRIKEFFRDYDKGRCGYITLSQFHRALDLCQLELSPGDIEALAAKYQGTDQWGRVNYTAFAAVIDAVFVTEGLETMPLAAVTTGFSATRNLALGKPVAALTAAEEAALPEVLARLKTFVATRKILMKTFFKDAEHNQNSVMIAEHVTKNQFTAAIVTLSMSLSPVDTNLLCKAFDDRGDGTVNHRLFCSEVDDPATWGVDPITGPANGTGPDHPGAPKGGKQPPVVPTAEVQALVDKITKVARVNSIRVHEFFQDFDKLRANAIPHKKFISGLTMALEKTGLYLCEADLMAITECFKADKVETTSLNSTVDMIEQPAYFKQFYVRWLDFCDAVDMANTIKGLENMPLGSTMYRAPAHAVGRSGGAPPAVLQSLREQIRVRGVLVKHFFQDFEANQNSVMVINHVTEQQFKQCMHRLDFAVSQAEVRAIAAFFDDRGDGTVNYRDFVNCVDPAPASINPWKTSGAESGEGCNGSVRMPGRAEQAAAAVVDRIKQCCLIHRIRIHEFFADFDRLRNGVVTKKQFEIALSMAFDKLDLKLTVPDVAELAAAYGDRQVPAVQLSRTTDLTTTELYYASNFVRWVEFCNDVDQVFVQKGLEAMPTTAMATGVGFAPESEALSAGEEAAASDLLGRLKHRLDTRRIELASWFMDFSASQNSPMRVNHVTPPQFRQVLAKLELAVTEPEARLLVKKYGVNDKTVNGGGFINYRTFCTDLQPPPPHINPWKTVGL